MRKFLISVALVSTAADRRPAGACRASITATSATTGGIATGTGTARRARRSTSCFATSTGPRPDRALGRSAGSSRAREAIGLRREANQIRVRLNRAARNGISGREFAELRVQVNRLEQRVRIERRDRDGRRD